jgi:hypothetical protein
VTVTTEPITNITNTQTSGRKTAEQYRCTAGASSCRPLRSAPAGLSHSAKVLAPWIRGVAAGAALNKEGKSAEAGATTRELMHRMGHGSMRAALIYQHATSDRDRQIADGLSRLVAPSADPSAEGSLHTNCT